MSSKSTIFLTKDNENCYKEGNMPFYDDATKEYIGSTIVLEMDKKNIRIRRNDESDLIIEIDPGSELYELIKMMRN